jgi:hypothetical protein
MEGQLIVMPMDTASLGREKSSNVSSHSLCEGTTGEEWGTVPRTKSDRSELMMLLWSASSISKSVSP